MSIALRNFFHGKMKLAFPVLFLYLWIIFIMYSGKNNLTLTVPLGIIMGLISLLLTFLILSLL